MYFLLFYLLLTLGLECRGGPIEELSNMPDLSLFYQQLIRQPDLQMILQNSFPQQLQEGTSDFTIFAPTNDAMSRLNRKNEDPNLLWKYHIVPGRYDDQTIYNMAQDKFNQANPRQLADGRPQNNLPTMALPFQLFYGIGFFGGAGPYINVSTDNAGYGSGGISWLTQTSFNKTNSWDNAVPLNPQLGNFNNYNPNQHTQNYVVAQGSAASGNPNLFPQNLSNYYTNVFNPNTNTQFLQNANVPNANVYPNYGNQQQQQQQNMYGPMGAPGVGIPRPTINNAFVIQTRVMSRGFINVIDSILWPPERRDQTQYKTAYDALEDNQFSRLRLLADRSDYFRSELRSMHHQTWFLPNDQAFASMGSGLGPLLDQSLLNNTNEINEFVRAHIMPLVLFPSIMDSTKQFSTLGGGRWMTFRKVSQGDQSFQIDVVSGRQVARILVSRPEDVKFYGNGIVYPIATVLSGPARSAADELARSYQYFMALVQQSGDTELVNLLQGNTAGLGITGPNFFNPQNMLNITVLIPQQMSVQQLGNSQELITNLRRHILRIPVYTDQLTMPAPGGINPFVQQNVFQPGQQPQFGNPAFTGLQQPPFIQGGLGQQQQFIPPQFQRSGGSQPAQPNFKPSRRRRRRRQLPIPSNQNFQSQMQQQQPQTRQQVPQQQMFQQQMPQQQMPQQQMPQQQVPRQQVPQQQMPQQQMPQQQMPQQQLPQQQMHQQQLPQQQVPRQQMPQQQMPQQQMPQQQMPQQQQPRQQLPQQQVPRQQLPLQQQPLPPGFLPTQPFPATDQQQLFNPTLNPNYYQMPSYPSSTVFQDGQMYPTMDPQFSVQARVSPGPNGNVVTLVGQSTNSLPFTATIVNTESNIPIKNGVMHVIRGIISGAMIPLDTVLLSVQGASSFNQFLQQTGVINEMKNSGRSYTIFIPTNAALQSIGVTTDPNRLNRFVRRHICADVLLDPTTNVFRRSGGFYSSRSQNLKQIQPPSLQRPRRRKRQGQSWFSSAQGGGSWRNDSFGQGNKAPDLGPGYFQPQQQVYGGYPAAPSPYGSYNQLYNPGYVMSGYASPNSEYYPGYNGTYLNSYDFNYNNLGTPFQMPVPSANNTFGGGYSPPINVVPIGNPAAGGGQSYYTGASSVASGMGNVGGPQSCMAMTGDRITVQPLAGTQPGAGSQSFAFQNYMVTCCGDQSVNAMVQSFNIYPPSFAVYLIGRTLLPQGQTISNMYSHTSTIFTCQLTQFIFLISILIHFFI